jgi:cystathionine beta-lyase/cystathionine gamma-synthase
MLNDDKLYEKLKFNQLMTHSSITKKEREQAGIKDSLIRVSIGVEDKADSLNDLEQAFQKI